MSEHSASAISGVALSRSLSLRVTLSPGLRFEPLMIAFSYAFA
jgi:hypothetical protein